MEEEAAQEVVEVDLAKAQAEVLTPILGQLKLIQGAFKLPNHHHINLTDHHLLEHRQEADILQIIILGRHLVQPIIIDQ